MIALLREIEHVCRATQQLVEANNRLATEVRVLQGRMERWEMYQVSIDPHYPLTQAHMADPEGKRAELQRRLNGGVR